MYQQAAIALAKRKESKLEEDQNSENLEVTPHDHEATIVEQEAPDETANPPQAQEELDKQDRNWREMRKKNDENVQKMKMQEEMIKTLLQTAQVPQQQVQQPVETVDEFEGIDDSEYLSKGDSRKMLRKDAKAIAREEFLRLEKERENANFLNRLKSRYSDFDDVVNPETIAIFEKKDPELASTIADLKDPYKMGLQTYNFIKSMSLKDDSASQRHAKEVKDKIEKNEKNAQSPQAYTKRPMAKAFSITGMSKEEQSALYEEMMGYASQGSGGY